MTVYNRKVDVGLMRKAASATKMAQLNNETKRIQRNPLKAKQIPMLGEKQVSLAYNIKERFLN